MMRMTRMCVIGRSGARGVPWKKTTANVINPCSCPTREFSNPLRDRYQASLDSLEKEHQKILADLEKVGIEVNEIPKAINKVSIKITTVEDEIKRITEELNGASANDKIYLLDDKKWLRDEKSKLIDKENKLIDKENKLIDEKKSLQDKENKLIDKENKLRDEMERITFELPDKVKPTPFKFEVPDDILSTFTANTDVCSLLTQDHFIDKSAMYYEVLKRYMDKEDVRGEKELKSGVLTMIYCRRFGKSTFLQFLHALLNPLPYNQNEIRSKIASLEKGPELLKLGVCPVVHMDFTDMITVGDLEERVLDGLQKAGLKEPVRSSSASAMLYSGCNALSNKFEKEMGFRRKTVVLIDEFDRPHRRLDVDDTELQLLRNAVVHVIALCKSDIGLMVVAGLTRMIGSGLSDVNILPNGDISQQIGFHGVVGILRSELLRSVGPELDERFKTTYGKSLEDILEEARRHWNGFSFGFLGKPNFEEFESLFSPVDIWHLFEQLNNANNANEETPPEKRLLDLLEETPSEWIKRMNCEFEFTNIGQKFKTLDSVQPLITSLAGGIVEVDVLERRIMRQDYIDFEEGHRLRILKELGLLSVVGVRNRKVTLAPPNSNVLRKSLEILLNTIPISEPLPRNVVEPYFKQERCLLDMVKLATRRFDSLYRLVRHTREYAVQDVIYLTLCGVLPSHPKASYEIRPESYFSRKKVDITMKDDEFGYILIEIKLSKFNNKISTEKLEEEHKKLAQKVKVQLLEKKELAAKDFEVKLKQKDPMQTNVTWTVRLLAITAVWSVDDFDEMKLDTKVEWVGPH